MKALTIGLLVAIAFIALSIGGVLYFAVPLDVQHVHADISVGGRNAFMLTNDSIMHFGTIEAKNSATRTITVENIRSHPIRATIYIDGPDWLSVSENNFRLSPSETQNVVFTADPLNDTPPGNYSWNISVVYRRR